MKSTNLHKQKSSMPGAKALLAIVVGFCFGHTQSFAQMKVGANPTTINLGSVLELESTTQGVLLPRVALANANTTWQLAGVPVEGMFVYNTNTLTGGTGVGVYYWYNLKWNYVQNGATAANTAWLLLGNAGTNATNNFIGTTDNIDFVVRTANTERIRVAGTNAASGWIGVNTPFVVNQQMTVGTVVAANTAIVGQNTTASGASTGTGILGTTIQSLGYGVRGTNSNAAGTGIWGESSAGSGASTGIGVLGTTLQSLGNGVKGTNTNNAGTAILGQNLAVASTGVGTGVSGSTLQSLGYGVKGTNGNVAGIAVLGQNTVASGTGGNAIGVEGLSAQSYNAGSGTNGFGVVALNSNASGTGLYAGGNNTGLNSVFIVNGSGATMVGSVGGFGYSSTASGIGIYGVQDNTTQFQRGVYGTYNAGGYGAGVVGVGAGGSAFGAATTLDIGVYGSALDYSVMGYNTTGGIGVYGYSEGSSTGVFGVNDDAQSFGVWGVNSNSSGTGVVGGGNGLISSYFVQGQGGAFTGSEIGASGVIPISADGGTFGTSYSEGSYGLFGRASRYIATTNQYGDVYQFGVYGEKIGYGFTAGQGGGYSERRSGGVLGLYYDDRLTGYAAWGSLGYVASTNSGTGTAGLAYGVYATAAPVRGNGYTGEYNGAGFGIGAYGGLMGGWVRGDFYGMNIKGERYGLYIDGYTYSNKPSVQLIDNGGSERTVAYNVSSLSADVYAHGKGKMVNGKAQINFDRGFTQIVDESDLAVTVTPIGESNGVHLVASTASGFSLQENKNSDNSFGSSDAEFTWIAVGKRKDVKSADIAKEVLDKDFDKNMDGVMFNENDMEHSAGSMQLTDGKLRFTPVTNSEKPVNGDKQEIRKAVKAVPPKNVNLKGDKLKMEKPEQEKNKVIVNKNNTGQKSDPPPAPKKD